LRTARANSVSVALAVLTFAEINQTQTQITADHFTVGIDIGRTWRCWLALLTLFAVPWLFIALGVKITSTGPALYWFDRVGRGNRIFRMPKFRTMRVGPPAKPTHLVAEPASHVTPLGALLR
jgi:lipopolysaccharide/colanic/teichoic acid biosynthesis glycosyltransferase